LFSPGLHNQKGNKKKSNNEIETIDGEYPSEVIRYGKKLVAVGIGKYPYNCIIR